MPVDAASATASAAAHATVSYTFTNLSAPWLGAVVVIAAIAAAWWGWKRYGPTPVAPWGTVARLARASALALVVVMLAGPAQVTTTRKDTPGRAVVVVDASASMAQRDGPDGQSRLAIAEAVYRALAASPLRPEWRVMGGTSGTYDPSTTTASGAVSPIGEELDRIVGERRPDLVVAISDWRVTHGPSPAHVASEWVKRSDIRLATLAVGSSRIEPELWIDSTEANREPAADEQELVRVKLAVRGSTAPITVEVFIDGKRADRKEIIPDFDPADPARTSIISADLKSVFTKLGSASMAIVVSGPGIERRAEIPVTVRSRPMKILMLAHRPSPEMRYLREAMKRDRTVTIHAYLADGQWRRWSQGSEAEAGPIRLPVDGSAPAQYDAIIIYDLGIDAFNPAQTLAIAEAVTKKGTGLIWIAGELGNLGSHGNSALGQLIPVDNLERGAIVRGFASDHTYQLRRTGVAEAQGLLDPGDLPWERLPDLRGSAPVTPATIKPGSAVLAEDLAGNPLVIARGYGTGMALFLAMDDTWRWRRNVGDTYLHRFHSQLLRFVASGRREGDSRWRLQVQPRRVSQGDLLSVLLLPSSSGVRAEAPQVSVRLAGPGGERVIALSRQGDGYGARIPAPQPGQWTIATIGETMAEPADLTVTPPASENRDPRVDMATAKAFAEVGGGVVHTTVESLLAALPKDLTRQSVIEASTGLWDTWWALAILLTLLAIDWAIRRWQRMP